MQGNAKKQWQLPQLVKKVPSISQGSVATYLRCSGIINDDYITNFMAKEYSQKAQLSQMDRTMLSVEILSTATQPYET